MLALQTCPPHQHRTCSTGPAGAALRCLAACARSRSFCAARARAAWSRCACRAACTLKASSIGSTGGGCARPAEPAELARGPAAPRVSSRRPAPAPSYADLRVGGSPKKPAGRQQAQQGGAQLQHAHPAQRCCSPLSAAWPCQACTHTAHLA